LTRFGGFDLERCSIYRRLAFFLLLTKVSDCDSILPVGGILFYKAFVLFKLLSSGESAYSSLLDAR